MSRIYFEIFLYSCILSHGIFDFFEASNLKINNELFNVVYQIIFIAYLGFTLIIPNFSLLIFLIFSCYHFGSDYQYLLNGNWIIKSYGLILIGISSFNKENTSKWVELTNFLYPVSQNAYNNQLTYQGIYIILTIFKSLGVLSLFWILLYSDFHLFLLSILFSLIVYKLGIVRSVILHLAIMHIPLIAYRIWKINGLFPIIIWIFISTIISVIFIRIFNMEKELNHKYIISTIISLTIPHMIITSIWEYYFSDII